MQTLAVVDQGQELESTRVIDPWLDLDLVFIRGFTTDGLLVTMDDDDDDAEMDE